ncbi:MAG TPA: AAA family ATPase, partial [Kofleriaceae bacterium]
MTPLVDFVGANEPDDDDSEDWIIRDIIPRGEPSLLVGPAKSGKTWVALDLAISVATGMPWLGGALENTLGRPGRVLCILLEDSVRRLGKRLWQLCRPRGIRPNVDPVLKEHLSITRALLRLPDKQDERDFAAELKRWRPDLVIVDNLTRVMVGDQDKTGGMAPFTKLWIQMCADIGAAIEFLHHTGKAGEWKPGMNTRDVFELIRGSSDLLAAARNAVVMFPMRAEDGEDASDLKMSDVRIRGNLDLRRESLVLGFERARGEDGRWSAQLRDL